MVLIHSTAKECPSQECVTTLKAGVWLASEGNRLRPDEQRERDVEVARGEPSVQRPRAITTGV